MQNELLPRKASTAISTKLEQIKQNNLSISDFGRQLTELFVDLTISQAEGNSKKYEVLKPINEKIAVKKFADGLRNRRLSTIIAARNFSSLKDAIQAAQDEDVSSSSNSGEIMGGALGPREAAQAVFPSLARALQKYLRATRQQPRHSADSVLAHLARCLSQDASPRAFLEPFFVEGPVLSAEQESRPLQRWALISDELLARPLASSVEFQLRQGDVSLICSIKQLPKFSLSEEVVDPKSNRFILRLNSETSV